MHRIVRLAVVLAASISVASADAFIFPVWLNEPPAAEKAKAEAQVKQILEGLFAAIPGAKRIDRIQAGCPWGQDVCWGYNEDGDNEDGIGGSDGSPDPGREPINTPPRPGFPGDIHVGDDGIIWICEMDPLGGCAVVGGDGSPDIDGGPPTPRPPGVWIAKPLSEYVADALAALPPDNPDEAALAEWVAAGLDPGAFDPCAYAAWKAEGH